MLQALYNGSTSSVRVRNELSEEFPIQTGVRQGDVASPLLFNIVIDAIMRKAFEGRWGVQYNWKRIVNDIRNPAAPTAAYWLRGRPALQIAS
uniref:Reverse transcriptase domain-containing protein n=1 Tax=Scleropages formosus TaxID=113540 RepID=A0A8D0CI05_SCLFO